MLRVISLIVRIADLSGVVAGSSTTQQTYSIDYLSQLLKDKKQLAAFPNVFHHLERLADEGAWIFIEYTCSYVN